VVELLPKAPALSQVATAPSYTQTYFDEFNRPFRWNQEALAWGAPSRHPPAWVERRERQVRWALPLLLSRDEPNPLLFADLSAGAGYYTLAYARHFQHVLHCDLSIDSLNYACFRARALGIDNIAFLRIDYFQPPFRSSVSRLICFDTLIRGEAHERLLLRSVKAALAPGGIALLDFHNWWHNPLRRVGLLTRNFPPAGSYTRRQTRHLLWEAGIRDYVLFPFHQEWEQRGVVAKLGAMLIPATRLVYRCSC
jgi:SAM-dependent methyltransferase